MFNRPVNEILVFPRHKYQLALPEQISSSTYQQCQDQGSKVVFIRPRKEIQQDLQRMSAWYYSERNVKHDLTIHNFYHVSFCNVQCDQGALAFVQSYIANRTRLIKDTESAVLTVSV